MPLWAAGSLLHEESLYVGVSVSGGVGAFGRTRAVVVSRVPQRGQGRGGALLHQL